MKDYIFIILSFLVFILINLYSIYNCDKRNMDFNFVENKCVVRKIKWDY